MNLVLRCGGRYRIICVLEQHCIWHNSNAESVNNKHLLHLAMGRFTMPVNAEKYFMTHRGIRTHDLDNTA